MTAIRFKTIYLDQNQGHGPARRAALDNCAHDVVALMDADDVSLPGRFEKQCDFLARFPGVDAVGGQITEFEGAEDRVVARREVPLSDAAIRENMKKRCPMNQVSVMLKKSAVEKAGGYRDWYRNEDYYLWARMALNGCVFANLPDDLVNVRAGGAMLSRRGGWKYFLSEARLQKYMLDRRMISPWRFCYNVAIRFFGEAVAGPRLRKTLMKFARSPCAAPEFVPAEKKPRSARRFPFSAALCVYAGDRAEWFDAALGSLVGQTLPPDEIVLVVDGPVPETIRAVIDKYAALCGAAGTQKEGNAR